MITVEDVQKAAHVLVELSRMYDHGYPSKAEWSADEILYELPHITAHLEQDKLLDEVAEKVIESLQAMRGGSVAENVKKALRGYEISRPLFPDSQLVTGSDQC